MKKNQIILCLILLTLIFSSCVVSKKKYQTLERSKKLVDKSLKELRAEKVSNLATIDSLNSSLTNTLNEYDLVKNQLLESNAKKTSEIDSLSYAVMSLASDTSQLNQNLKQAISLYEVEKDNMLALQADYQEKEKKLNDLQAELEEKKARLAELEKMIDNNKAAMKDLKNTIAEALVAFDDTELTVVQKDGKIYVSLDEKLLFKTGSSQVDPNGKKAISQLAAVLADNPDIDITIEGHTDNVGDAKFNWDLSVRRATSIINIIQENTKIDPARLTASGRGMYHPVENENTEEARSKNRRTEIILMPKLDVLYNLLNEDVNNEEETE